MVGIDMVTLEKDLRWFRHSVEFHLTFMPVTDLADWKNHPRVALIRLMSPSGRLHRLKSFQA